MTAPFTPETVKLSIFDLEDPLREGRELIHALRMMGRSLDDGEDGDSIARIADELMERWKRVGDNILNLAKA